MPTNQPLKPHSNRRAFLQTALLSGAAATLTPVYAAGGAARDISATIPNAAAPVPQPADVKPFELDEITIPELQNGMKSGKFTARSLAEKYLARIDEIDKPEIDKRGPALNAIIELNPDALSIADALDQERKATGSRSPLHGIPVLIKDNIGTADRMMTTAGSLALVGSKPLKDSFVAQRLRAAGAVILGKTNLSEWANIRSSHSVSGWSGRGGLTKNPYALDRNPCGSSSGTGAGISANLAAAGIGTETDGSIVCPSSSNGLAGIKPTVGLVSRSGIIPISHRTARARCAARCATRPFFWECSLASTPTTQRRRQARASRKLTTRSIAIPTVSKAPTSASPENISASTMPWTPLWSGRSA